VKKMSILQQILLSLLIAGCVSDPQPREDNDAGDPPSRPPDSQSVDETTLGLRELFAKRFGDAAYQTAVQQGRLYSASLPQTEANRQPVYGLEYDGMRFFVRPNIAEQVILEMSTEQQQYYHARSLRHFFTTDSPLLGSNIDTAYAWLVWFERYVYEADILTKREEAMQFFQDQDRLIATINPFFQINFDGRFFRIDYFTKQQNQLWQKRITLSPYAEIVRFQQDPIDLELRRAM
jgi:hypothetical protein